MRHRGGKYNREHIPCRVCHCPQFTEPKKIAIAAVGTQVHRKENFFDGKVSRKREMTPGEGR